MCGIIGMYTDNYGAHSRALLKQLFIESQIRGKHATGVSFIKGGKVKTSIKQIPSIEFVKSYAFHSLPAKLRLIGHCRYSTSDLKYNQPIQLGEQSVVHNGVITQEDPKYWKEHFKYHCTTRNDSELLLRCLLARKYNNPFIKFKTSSVAAIHLNGKQNSFTFFRNGTRPLWWCVYLGSVIVASTKDIVVRAFENGLGVPAPVCRMVRLGIFYEVLSDGTIIKVAKIKRSERIDMQNELLCAKYYKKL